MDNFNKGLGKHWVNFKADHNGSCCEFASRCSHDGVIDSTNTTTNNGHHIETPTHFDMALLFYFQLWIMYLEASGLHPVRLILQAQLKNGNS